jgi:hypothetical protein
MDRIKGESPLLIHKKKGVLTLRSTPGRNKERLVAVFQGRIRFAIRRVYRTLK